MDDGTRGSTETAIMEATYEALSAHGYADLTIQRIADAFPKSKSLLYYHYDDKQAILRAFLDWLVDEFRADFERGFDADADADPRETLEELLDQLLPTRIEEEERTFRVAILALQARAAHDSDYAERFDELFTAIEAALVVVLERGIASGAFRDVNPERFARLILAVASGGITWTLSTGTQVTPEIRDALEVVLEGELYA